MGLVLALLLSAPVVGVQTDGEAPCDASAFARDLRTLRPELTVVPLEGEPPPGIWIAILSGLSSGEPVLHVTGNPTPVVRSLAGQECRRVVQIGASIVDGLLDQLPREGPGPLTAPIPLRTSLGIWLGGGVLQGPIHWVPDLALGLRLTLGPWEIIGIADIGTLATRPVSTELGGTLGNVYRALPFDFEIGGGYGFRPGLGRLSFDALAGPSVVKVWTSPSSGSFLFQREEVLLVEAFFALAAGYSIDLPARFFLGARVEERWSPAHTTVSVEGGTSSVATRTWVFTSSLFAGWRFF